LTLLRPFVTVETLGGVIDYSPNAGGNGSTISEEGVMEMRRNTLIVALSFALLPLTAWGQDQKPALPLTTQEDIYCSGMVSTDSVPRNTQLVSGEQSEYKITFDEGDYVYVNRGSNKGVKVGDTFSVMRPIADLTNPMFEPLSLSNDFDEPRFQAQGGLLRSMGQMWEDEGRLKVVMVYPNTSIAQITNSCAFMQRGDIVRPFEERPVPQLKSEANFDRFAPPSGNKKGVVVVGKNFRSVSGTNDIVYINLGSKQGAKVGDYVRIFRYQENGDSTNYQTPNMATDVWGFGTASGRYSGKDLPREVLGEGIVLRATPNAATVLITFSLREIYGGDYCELE
jgi:hypothetical protein